MAKKLAYSTLNAGTADIMNVIRANASYQYQSMVPKVDQYYNPVKVGEIIMGTPSITNEFINSLVNRIALVVVNSAVFNNPYSGLKKGYVEFGEIIEEVFVEMAKARSFSVEKAYEREFRRTVPKAKSAFHAVNWEVQYPVTIENKDLKRAFLSWEGVRDLIADIVDQVYRGAQYDEYLLFKYLLIKQIAHGRVYTQTITDDISANAVQFRGYANILTFPSPKYNYANVRNTVREGNLNIFMDSFYNAKFDVEVLAGAFNMDKADFLGRLHLIDDWSTFDSERFSEIMKESTQLEEVTQEELNLMKNIKAVIVDSDFFQVYDNMSVFTETYVASGMYWNYNYNVFKTISFSPFANIVCFAQTDENTLTPANITMTVAGVEKDKEGNTIVEFTGSQSVPSLVYSNCQYVQTEECVKSLVGVLPYGVYIFPNGAPEVATVIDVLGKQYQSADKLNPATVSVGTEFTFTPSAAGRTVKK